MVVVNVDDKAAEKRTTLMMIMTITNQGRRTSRGLVAIMYVFRGGWNTCNGE